MSSTPKPDTPSPAVDEPERCDRCGWPLKERIEDGCVRDNCSQRPLQPLRTIYSAAEYYSMRKRRDELRSENARLKEVGTAAITGLTEALSAANTELARLKEELATALAERDGFCAIAGNANRALARLRGLLGRALLSVIAMGALGLEEDIRAALAINTTRGGREDDAKR